MHVKRNLDENSGALNQEEVNSAMQNLKENNDWRQ